MVDVQAMKSKRAREVLTLRRSTRTLTISASSLLARSGRGGGLWRHLVATYHERKRARQGLRRQTRPTRTQLQRRPMEALFILASTITELEKNIINIGKEEKHQVVRRGGSFGWPKRPTPPTEAPFIYLFCIYMFK